MNEQIKALAQQAGGFVDLNQHVGGGKGCMVYTYEGLEQFAQLIVKECSYLADQAHHKATGGKTAGGYIRQQFGVDG